jgi:SpoVK/Ycf46/Vps4 family AAA+-type ATPase
VAKIIGKIYQALNVLSPNGTFKVAYRDDFVAGYLGQTATKTKKLLQSSIGGVLFIDEVYSLAPRSNDRDSFAKEAIDTLTGFLSEHKNDFCCIIAGYEDEIQNCFFAMNKGLERRFPWVHRITQYKAKELYEIFIKMVRDIEWDISFDEKFMLSFFEKHKDMFKNAGGDIETFLTKCKMFHSRRVFCLGKEHKFIISKEDVKQAIEFLEKNKPKEDKPPEHMYL